VKCFQKGLQKDTNIWKKWSFLWLKGECSRSQILSVHSLHWGGSQYPVNTTWAYGLNTTQTGLKIVSDVFSQLLHAPPKINISSLNPMADLEETGNTLRQWNIFPQKNNKQLISGVQLGCFIMQHAKYRADWVLIRDHLQRVVKPGSVWVQLHFRGTFTDDELLHRFTCVSRRRVNCYLLWILNVITGFQPFKGSNIYLQPLVRNVL